MHSHVLPLLAAFWLAIGPASVAWGAEKKNGEAGEVASLVCVEAGSGGFHWTGDEAELEKLANSSYLVKMVSKTERTVTFGEREWTLRCFDGGEGMTLCRRGYETWDFKGDKSFTFSYIHGGVVGGSSNIFVSYGECEKP